MPQKYNSEFWVCLLSFAGLEWLAFSPIIRETSGQTVISGESFIVALIGMLPLLALYIVRNSNSDQGIRSAPYDLNDGNSPKIASELLRVIEMKFEKISAEIEGKIGQIIINNAHAAESDDALSVLARDLQAREKETQRLHDLLIRRNHHNALARLATIRETAEFTRKINDEGKITDKEALTQLIMEIDAAIDDIGLEIMHVAAGTRISELPNGSFTILSAITPDSVDLAGTVKEAVTEAVFVRDENGKQVFIAPAKLRAYKL